MSSLFSSSLIKLTILPSSKSTFPTAIASRIVVSLNSCCNRLVEACSCDNLFHFKIVRPRFESGSERSYVVRSWSRISSPRENLAWNALISWSRLFTTSWTADSLVSYLGIEALSVVKVRIKIFNSLGWNLLLFLGNLLSETRKVWFQPNQWVSKQVHYHSTTDSLLIILKFDNLIIVKWSFHPSLHE